MEEVIARGDHAGPWGLNINHVHADDALHGAMACLNIRRPFCIKQNLLRQDLPPVVVFLGQEARGNQAPRSCVGLQQKNGSLRIQKIVMR